MVLHYFSSNQYLCVLKSTLEQKGPRKSPRGVHLSSLCNTSQPSQRVSKWRRPHHSPNFHINQAFANDSSAHQQPAVLGQRGWSRLESNLTVIDSRCCRELQILLSLAPGKVQEGGCTYILFYCLVLFMTKEGLALKAKYTLFTQHEPPLGWKHRILITFYKCLLQTRLQAGQGYGNTFKCVLTVYRNESVSTSPYFKCAGRKCKSINR